jgi:hypothetical protein
MKSQLIVFTHYIPHDGGLTKQQQENLIEDYKLKNEIIDEYNNIKNIYFLTEGIGEVKCVYPIETTKVNIFRSDNKRYNSGNTTEQPRYKKNYNTDYNS